MIDKFSSAIKKTKQTNKISHFALEKDLTIWLRIVS